MSKWNVKFITNQNKSVIVHVCFVLFIFCLYICVCECLLQNNNHKTKHKNNTNRGVPKSQAAPVYLIPVHHLFTFLMFLALAAWRLQTEGEKNQMRIGDSSGIFELNKTKQILNAQ